MKAILKSGKVEEAEASGTFGGNASNTRVKKLMAQNKKLKDDLKEVSTLDSLPKLESTEVKADQLNTPAKTLSPPKKKQRPQQQHRGGSDR